MSYQTHTNKVSMVMACYNKAEYIGRMFDSIIAQTYDNIELILINDGSTDGTRDIIWDYSDKLRDRGFEVTIIEQKNAGVCAANKAGYTHVTGDFICAVDCDDLLDPNYVKAAVDVLLANPDVDYTYCDNLWGDPDDLKPAVITSNIYAPPAENPWRLIVSDHMSMAVWQFMLRREYFDKIGIAKYATTHRDGSHEPDFTLAVVLGGGRYIYIDAKLYCQRALEESHSFSVDPKKIARYYDNYLRLANDVISRFTPDPTECEKKLREYALFIATKELHRLPDSAFENGGADDMIRRINRAAAGMGLAELPAEYIRKDRWTYRYMILLFLAGEYPIEKRPGRFIGFGALGKNAAALLPLFKSHYIAFDEFWDSNADNDSVFDGKKVTRPDYDSLTANDNVFIFPLNDEEIIKSLSDYDCNILRTPDNINKMKLFWGKGDE